VKAKNSESKVPERDSLPENLADNVLNCSRSMLSIINRDYVYEKVNTAFCSAHKIAPELLVGKTLSEVWGEAIFDKKIKSHVDSCLRGNTIRYEASFDTPYFGNRYYEVVFRPIITDDGKISHLLVETFDITDLKLSRQILNEMEEEVRKIETNLPIGFLRCEADGTVIQANKAFLNIMEFEYERDVTGTNIKDYYCEKSLFDIHLRQLFQEQRKTFGRVPLYTCRKNEIACRISGFIVTGDSNTPPFIDFAFEDSSRELMLENRLMQAQKLETIGVLAGGLAHDFNNILATIYGYSELLLDDYGNNTEAADKISRIISAVSRARSLTSQILTFSRQVEQQKIPVSIHEVLKETIGFISSGKPSNISLVSDLPYTDALVYADPTQLFRVFLNLMTNAIQAMETCGGTLTVSMSTVEGNLVQHELSRNIVADEYVQILIKDTGIGMDPSIIQRIFEPYFTTKDSGRGTGMGLSVVHGILSEIEGEILVSSKPGKGSVFTLYLPITEKYSESALTEAQKMLLFITGNRYESRILSLALEKSGYSLTFASDTNSILKVMSDSGKTPDLVIYMADAEEVTAEDIRDLFAGNKIETPLILITDNDQYVAKEKLLNSGIAKQVLIKPVSLKEIQNAIQMSLT
jgi:signal transduction histidine kinase/CheY-like chemotaxis protein